MYECFGRSPQKKRVGLSAISFFNFGEVGFR